ncbi:non-ribosomal peptide synthetase [Gordonia rubripertincta]|uniref:non-ribosomal peptide synthetase n=1 Tax=Gordonia rubripertincta TaxID=36822 RepID=UPI000B8DBB55|nr:non-ribosomal peptide synthetase [Gordonia rubripertincta]ASR01426.1 Phenyloxazoline synthase MbtB [Gordonia rubripertincta]
MATNSEMTDPIADLVSPADIRAQVAAALGVASESLDPTQDLIAQGLDSLRMMRLAGTWRKRGIDIDFARLAAQPTLDAWIEMLAADATPAPAAREAASPENGAPAVPDIRGEIATALGVAPESLDPTQDLIAQGLDSLRMMRLAGTWRKRGIDIDFARLAAQPTLDAWIALLGEPSTPAETSASPENVDPTAPFPLAPMQHAYWIGRSDSHAFGNVAAHLYIEFDGHDLDPDRFTSAMGELLQRHPMLRVRVLPDGTQAVGPAHPDAIAVHDLRAQPAEMVEAILAEKRSHGTHRTLPVEEGAVIRAELSLLPDRSTRVHLDVDMIAADAMSYRVLVDDFARLYRGETLPELGVTFATITADRASREIRDEDLAWWRERIPHLPGPPELPLDDRAARGEVEPRSVRLHHSVSASEWKRLEEHAHRRGVTPAAAVAAAFAEAVGTHAANSRFLLTVPLFDRPQIHADVERVVGDFTSSILVDVDLRRPATLAERARHMRSAMHDAAAHGSMSGLDVLRELGRARGESVVSPIVFTSALGLGDLFSPQATDVLGDPAWIVSQGPQVLLDAQVTEIAGGLLLNWDVRVSDLDETTARAMFDYYVRLLGLLVDGEWDAQAPDPVDDDVRAQRLSVEEPLPETDTFDGTLHGSVFARAAQRSSDPAVITDTRTWTHGELTDEALRVAGALTAAGVRPGDTVVVSLPKSGDQIVAALAVLAVGAAYVPIAPTQPAARRDRIVSIAGPRAVLTADADAWAEPYGPTVIDLETARTSAPVAPVEVTGEELAYILFTSGSTGLPKGVQVPHRAAVATITDLVDRYSIDARDRSLQVSSLEFDLSVFDIFGLLTVGGAVVVPGDDERTKVDDWVRLLADHSVSVLNCVPSILGMILDLGSLPSSMRMIIMGGDKVDVSLLDRVAAQLPDCRVAGLGGTTETAIHSTICEADDVPAGMAFVPYGVPLRGVRCRVVDEIGRDRPDLVPGELWIGGAGVADGYRGDPERTADRFVHHDGEKWYRTGDLARYLPGGFLDFLGRADHMVKVRGYRVEFGEVEAGLLALDEVGSAVAWSDGRDLHAAVVAGTDADESTIRAGLTDSLPPQMIPRSIIRLDTLPLTANGKYDRKALTALVDTAEGDPQVVAPGTPLEEALVVIFSEVLPVRPIGVTEDFISLGGDSVQATRLVALSRTWLDAPRLSVADIFGHRTIAGLAERLTALEGPRVVRVAEIFLDVVALSDEQVDAELAGT